MNLVLYGLESPLKVIQLILDAAQSCENLSLG
jgi:hypothetical protein